MELLTDDLPQSNLAQVELSTEIPGQSNSRIVRATVVRMGIINTLQGDPEFALMVCMEHLAGKDISPVMAERGIKEDVRLSVQESVRRSARFLDIPAVGRAVDVIMDAHVFAPNGNGMVRLRDAEHLIEDYGEGDGWLNTKWR